MGSLLLTRVLFGSLNRCGVLKQRDYLNELFDKPHRTDTLLVIASIWFRYHEKPQFYKSAVCEPCVNCCLSWICGHSLNQHYINIGSNVDQRWINNDPSTIIEYTMCHVHNMVLSDLQYQLDGVWERGWNCMDTSNLKFRKRESFSFALVLWPFIYLLSRICGHRLYQWWINDGSTM